MNDKKIDDAILCYFLKVIPHLSHSHSHQQQPQHSQLPDMVATTSNSSIHKSISVGF